MEPGLRRRLAAAVACLTMTAGLSGCFLNDPNDAESGLGGNAFAAGGTQDGDGKVQIMGTFGGPEQKALLASLEDFEKESGIEIDYVSEKDLPTVIKQKAKAGDTPRAAERRVGTECVSS